MKIASRMAKRILSNDVSISWRWPPTGLEAEGEGHLVDGGLNVDGGAGQVAPAHGDEVSPALDHLVRGLAREC
jgi:hypothetical protein